MALRNIITPADDRLRRAALKVTSFDKTFQQLVDDRLLTMHAAPGVGLAAPGAAHIGYAQFGPGAWGRFRDQPVFSAGAALLQALS